MASPNDSPDELTKLGLSAEDDRVMVLLVDDQAIIGEAIRRALMHEAGLSFHYCARPEEAVATAARLGATVILQDLVMPGVDGLALVRQYRANPATRDIPIIVLSSKEEAAIKGQAFAAGANDYLVKLPDNVELIARVRYHSRAYIGQRQRDVAYRALADSQEQLVALNLELHRLNRVDGLTGLSNRRYLDEMLRLEWARGIRSGSALSVLMIDIDDFKKYNDTYGHLAGDDALKLVAGVFGDSLQRSADLAARFGGEEFTAILPMTPLAGAAVVGERVRAAVAGLKLSHSGSTVGAHMTVSIGGASVIPHLGGHVPSLLEAADLALYEAKYGGKDRVVIATSSE